MVLRLADRGRISSLSFNRRRTRVAAERISFKLVSVLDVRQEVLFDLREFRSAGDWQFSSSPFSRPFAMRLALRFRPVEALGTRFGSRRHTVAKAETTGYVRAFRRAFDSQQRCRLR